MAHVAKQFEVRYGVKKCDVENCPCCGGYTEKYASPRCVQSHTGAFELEACLLFWHCDHCGCEWRHGQYAVKETCEAVKETKEGK